MNKDDAMMKRFSPDDLFFFRNHLPIRTIITAVLKLNSHSRDGVFRFECPLCHGFDTATNPATNLARCFSCRKNFNPIDLVMAARSLSFRSAVALLQTVRSKLPSVPPGSPKTPTAQTCATDSPRSELTRIGELLTRYKLHSS